MPGTFSSAGMCGWAVWKSVELGFIDISCRERFQNFIVVFNLHLLLNVTKKN